MFFVSYFHFFLETHEYFLLLEYNNFMCFGTFVIACLVNLKYSRILVATLYMYERDTIST